MVGGSSPPIPTNIAGCVEIGYLVGLISRSSGFKSRSRNQYGDCSSFGRAPDCGSGGSGIVTRLSPKGEAVQAVVSTPLIRVTILKKG